LKENDTKITLNQLISFEIVCIECLSNCHRTGTSICYREFTNTIEDLPTGLTRIKVFVSDKFSSASTELGVFKKCIKKSE
jgi:hypothetical protein